MHARALDKNTRAAARPLRPSAMTLSPTNQSANIFPHFHIINRKFSRKIYPCILWYFLPINLSSLTSHPRFNTRDRPGRLMTYCSATLMDHFKIEIVRVPDNWHFYVASSPSRRRLEARWLPDRVGHAAVEVPTLVVSWMMMGHLRFGTIRAARLW